MGEQNYNFRPLLIASLIVIIIWALSWFVTTLIHPDLVNRGMLGDSFGLINSLFSALAFAGIIYTIILQRNELKLQREELTETRKELKRSADAQDRSEKQLRRQSANLKQTAKLNALNTLLNYYIRIEQQNTNKGSSIIRQDAISRQKEYVGQIQAILDQKQN